MWDAWVRLRGVHLIAPRDVLALESAWRVQRLR